MATASGKPEESSDQESVGMDDGGSGAPPASRSGYLIDSGHDDGFSTEDGIRDRQHRANLVRKESMAHLHSTANVDDSNIHRQQSVKVRKETAAVGLWERCTRNICSCRRKTEEPSKKDDDFERKQYTIKSKKKKKMVKHGFWRNFLAELRYTCCFCFGHYTFDGFDGEHISKMNRALVNHLNWTFKTSFLIFLSYSAVWFYMLVIVFAGFITIAGNARPECVLIGGDKFGHSGTEFSDAFSISWHTFSTVGYGSAYPALSADNGKIDNVCVVISMICVIEAFIGILYGAIVGSILFGKIARIQGIAQVVFSDPVLVRYGAGATGDVEDYADADEDSEEEDRRLPCPVLEFRIANLLHDKTGGEILDSSINVVASLDAEETDAELRDGAHTTVASLMHALMSHSSHPGSTHDTEEDVDLELGNDVTVGRNKSLKKKSLRLGSKNVSGLTSSAMAYLGMNSTAVQEVDEDPTQELAQKRIFAELVLDSPEHPYFKRVWIVRHVLDGHSPLLKADVRKLVRKNGGHWPCELNSPEKVRESLQFNQILVSLNGILNVSGSDVYAQKTYSWVDLAVGYHFVNLLYKGQDDNIKVDLDLINDVREQRGGGGEDLTAR